MSGITVSVVQFDSKKQKYEDNLNKAIKYIEMAFQKGSDYVLLHEMWLAGYVEKVSVDDIKYTREALKVLGNISKRYSKHIIAGSMLEEKGDGLPFNTSFVIAPTGEVSTKYQKIHLFPLMDEDKKYSPGSKLCFFSAGDIKVGIIICYDIRFPEEVMVLAEIGIEVLFVPAQWPLIRKKHWLTLLKARAIENQIYVVGANRVGQEGETVFAGNSVIIDPLGEIQELIEDKEGIITCRMDLDKLKSIRKENPFQESKRRDLYQKWAES